jgi:hypothetical protein
MNHKIIAHFQQLWGVQKLDGVYPKMNEIYLCVRWNLPRTFSSASRAYI